MVAKTKETFPVMGSVSFFVVLDCMKISRRENSSVEMSVCMIVLSRTGQQTNLYLNLYRPLVPDGTKNKIQIITATIL